MLQVIISIIFVMLTLSLFATTLMEIIASMFSLRGKQLMRGIKRMLAGSNQTEILEEFKNNAHFQQLTSRFLFAIRPPSYLSSSTFASILWNVLTKDKSIPLRSKIEGIKDQNLQNILLQLFDQTDIKKAQFEHKIAVWYDEVMERVSGWYKRNTQAILIVIGLFISICFDADTVSIYHQLANNPEKQIELLTLAENYIAKNEENDLSSSSIVLQHYDKQLSTLLDQNLSGIVEPLGLGWYEKTNPKSFNEWLLKILGWLVTTLGISLGAPFWFDLLKKMMMIKNAGGAPQTLAQSDFNQTSRAMGIKLETINNDSSEFEFSNPGFINQPVG
jgi:hypothetical protein